MGISIVFIIILVIGIILCKKDIGEEIELILFVVGGVGTIGCAITILLNQTTCNYDKKIELEEKYNAIQQIMNDDFKNGDVRVKNQVYDDIAEYNADIRKNKHYRDSIWFNWLVCPCYDEFEVIEYDKEIK